MATLRLIGTSAGSFSKLLNLQGKSDGKKSDIKPPLVVLNKSDVDVKPPSILITGVQSITIPSSSPPSISPGNKLSSSPQKQRHISVPSKMHIIYNNDYNIILAHEVILQKLENEKLVLVPTLQTSLNVERGRVSRPQTVLERKSTLSKISQLEHEIKEIMGNVRINKYKDEVADIINKYNRIGQLNVKVTFGQEDMTVNKDPQNVESMMYRHELISSFALIASKYYDIKIVRDIKQHDLFKCQCGESITITTVDETGSYICDKCNYQTFLPCYVTNVDANGANNNNNKSSDYDNWENLHKEFQKIQGLQHDKIPESLLLKLDKYFDSKGIASRNTYEKYSVEDRSWYQGRKGTDIEIMVKALQDIKEPDYYEDVHLLAKKVWGWELADLSGYESRISEDYKATQKVFLEMDKERKSSLGTRYRLFKHLQLVGVNCQVKDFKMSIMREVINEHDELWEKMCLGANKKNIYFIKTLK
jgi:hypothetical protein